MYVQRPSTHHTTARALWDWLEGQGFRVEELAYNATIPGWYMLATRETSTYAKTFTPEEVSRIKKGLSIDAF